MTLILNGTDNSATTPAVTGTDTDTGVYYPAANQVALATNGTLALIVDSSQRVGIGAGTTGLGRLEIQQSATTAGLWVQTGGTTSSYTIADFRTGTNAPALTIFGNATSSFASTIGVGGTTPSTSGAGITFPATQSASSDANTLDDYEEGTFTLTATPASGGSITLDVKTGSYTKVGRLVTITGFANVLSVSSPSGAQVNFNLPFTAASLTGQAGRSGGAVTYYNGAGQTNAPFYVLSGNATLTVTQNAALVATNHDWSLGFSYITAT